MNEKFGGNVDNTPKGPGPDESYTPWPVEGSKRKEDSSESGDRGGVVEDVFDELGIEIKEDDGTEQPPAKRFNPWR